ncbi:MAG: hypothetical protein H6909_00700 [Rickettsiaceae bacterium]|nr:hypothetical protein [Rickettsiaceae bacterium]
MFKFFEKEEERKPCEKSQQKNTAILPPNCRLSRDDEGNFTYQLSSTKVNNILNQVTAPVTSEQNSLRNLLSQSTTGIADYYNTIKPYKPLCRSADNINNCTMERRIGFFNPAITWVNDDYSQLSKRNKSTPLNEINNTTISSEGNQLVVPPEVSYNYNRNNDNDEDEISTSTEVTSEEELAVSPVFPRIQDYYYHTRPGYENNQNINVTDEESKGNSANLFDDVNENSYMAGTDAQYDFFGQKFS